MIGILEGIGYGVYRRDQASPMSLSGQQIDKIAKAIHQDYRKNNPGSRCDMPWEGLPWEIKQSNLNQAISFAQHLEMLGLKCVPDGDAGQAIDQLTDEQLERVSERVHDVWVKSKIEMGWALGPSYDECNKLHPLLVGWDKLPPEEKKKDSDIAKSIIPLLQDSGLRVHRQL